MFWLLVTRLGEAFLLAPALACLVAWLLLEGGGRAMLRAWVAALVGVVALTLASKIAFIGWGWGIAALDFTGFSGHALVAAAIHPLLFGLSVRNEAQQRVGWALGLTLALVVAASRVVIGVHSVSEVVLGYGLGALTSEVAWRAVRRGQGPRRAAPLWLPLVLIGWVGFSPGHAPQLVDTHGIVTRVALVLSGRDRPYTREDLHRVAETRAFGATLNGAGRQDQTRGPSWIREVPATVNTSLRVGQP